MSEEVSRSTSCASVFGSENMASISIAHLCFVNRIA